MTFDAYKLGQTRAKTFLAGFLSLLAVGAGYLISAWVSNSSYVAQLGLAQLLFGILALLVGIWLLVMAARGVKGIFTPLGAILIGFETFILIGPLLLPEWASYLYSNPARIIRAWVAVLLGLSGLVVGYYFQPKVRKETSHIPKSGFLYRSLEVHRLFWVGVLLILFRMFFFRSWYSRSGAEDYFLSAGHFAISLEGGYWFWGWWFANIATFVGVTCLARVVFAPESLAKPYRLLGFSLLLVSFYSTLLEGNRGRFAIPLIGVLVLIVLLRWRRRYQRASTNTLLKLVMLSFVGLMFTGIIWQTEFRTMLITEAFQEFAARGFSLTGPSLAERGGDMLIYLDRILDEFGTITSFRWGESYIAPFLLLIPRQIWSGKPVGVAAYLDNAGPTIIGELYANFSWGGVFLGMVLLGFMLQLWLRFYLNHWQSDFINMSYAMSFGILIYQVRGDFNTVTSYWLYSMLLLFLTWQVCSKKQVRQRMHWKWVANDRVTRNKRQSQ